MSTKLKIIDDAPKMEAEGDDFRVDPTPNGVVFFPSSLRHTSVPQPGVRFTLSANFNAESYGSQSGLNQL